MGTPQSRLVSTDPEAFVIYLLVSSAEQVYFTRSFQNKQKLHWIVQDT